MPSTRVHTSSTVSTPQAHQPQSEVSMPSLAAYTEYRAFLNDYYEAKRQATRDDLRPYSYATFSAAANIKSPNYLKLIIQGQRNLSPAMIRKFARALQLNKEETEEFTVLVKYGQAKDPLERNQYLKELAEIRVKRQLKNGEIPVESYKRVPSWVMWVLYALVDQKGVEFDVKRLQELLRGKAKAEEIERSLERLVSSGELLKDPETGLFTKGRELMAGRDNIPVALVRKLQAELIYLGLESLFQDEPQDREFGALTVALTEDEFEHLKFELRQLRKRLFKDLTVERAKEKGDRVFQLNIQLFPVTKSALNE